MFGELFVAALLLADSKDPIRDAIEHYREVAAYQVMVKSSGNGDTAIMRYYFKKPGYVRMEFIKPFNGAVLIYDPVSKQAHLWPFGHRGFPSFALSPENSLIQSSTGQRVDQSDVGALYRNVQALQERGKTAVSESEPVNGKATLHVTVEGDGDFSAGAVHRYQLSLDQATAFPVKVSSYDVTGRLIEVVEMSDLQINPKFPDSFFNP